MSQATAPDALAIKEALLNMVHEASSPPSVPGRLVVLAILGMAIVLALVAVRYRKLAPRGLPPAATTAATTVPSDSPAAPSTIPVPRPTPANPPPGSS